MGRPIRILLVEDNKVFREALELLLGLRADVEIVAAVGDGAAAAPAAQATAAVREACPDVAVVCLTASANTREVEALYEAGASACLTKDQELEDIVDAIKRAARRLPADGA